MKVAIIEEDGEEDAKVHGFVPDSMTEDSESIRVGGKKGQQRISDEPLEAQKASIVKQLVGMNANIRNFSENMEKRLEEAYKAGNYNKKFGYEGSNARNMET